MGSSLIFSDLVRVGRTAATLALVNGLWLMEEFELGSKEDGIVGNLLSCIATGPAGMITVNLDPNGRTST